MKEQKRMRYTDEELNLIKSMFADNEELLYTLRKIFFFNGLSEVEVDLIKKAFPTEASHHVLRKSFLPEIELSNPLAQVIDLWMTVEVKEKGAYEVDVILKSRQILIAMIEEGLERISNPTTEAIDATEFNLGENSFENHVNITARNTYISHIGMILQQLNLLAGRKTETIEETKTRLAKDSTK